MCVFSPAFHHLLPASKSIQGSILPEFLQHPSHWPQLLWSLAWPQQWPEVSPTGGIRLDANVVVFVFPLLVFRDLSVKMFLWPSRKCFKKNVPPKKSAKRESQVSSSHFSATFNLQKEQLFTSNFRPAAVPFPFSTVDTVEVAPVGTCWRRALPSFESLAPAGRFLLETKTALLSCFRRSSNHSFIYYICIFKQNSMSEYT